MTLMRYVLRVRRIDHNPATLVNKEPFEMSNSNNIHVVQRENGWGTLREGGERASHVFESQAEAISAGREMARQGRGELFIHGQDGRIRARDSHGHDPCPPKDSK